jgi:hypothetical protein
MVRPRGVTLQGEESPLEEGNRFDHTVAVAALSKEVIQLCFNAIAHPDDNEL